MSNRELKEILEKNKKIIEENSREFNKSIQRIAEIKKKMINLF